MDENPYQAPKSPPPVNARIVRETPIAGNILAIVGCVSILAHGTAYFFWQEIASAIEKIEPGKGDIVAATLQGVTALVAITCYVLTKPRKN